MADRTKLDNAENINREYTNTYADQINSKLDNYTGRDYKYDPSADNLYQNYKKEYMTEAQQARTGVVNSGLRLSGGYGNDFSQSVGEQQYQTYLANINRLAPAFENLEYARYQGETDDLANQLKLLATMENTDYGRNRDAISDKEAYRNYLANNYQFDSNLELKQNKVANTKDSADKDYELRLYKDKLNEFIAQKQAEEAAARAAASRARGGGGGGGSYGGGYDAGYYGDYTGNGSYSSGNGGFRNQEVNVMVGNTPQQFLIVDGQRVSAAQLAAGAGTQYVAKGDGKYATIVNANNWTSSQARANARARNK